MFLKFLLSLFLFLLFFQLLINLYDPFFSFASLKIRLNIFHFLPLGIPIAVCPGIDRVKIESLQSQTKYYCIYYRSYLNHPFADLIRQGPGACLVLCSFPLLLLFQWKRIRYCHLNDLPQSFI